MQDLPRAFNKRVLGTTLRALPIPMPGLEMAAVPMDYIEPGAAGALVQIPGKDSGIGGTLIYFNCKSLGV